MSSERNDKSYVWNRILYHDEYRVMDGKVSYVLEGNINYTGAVITWLLKDLRLINSELELEPLAAHF